MSADNQWCFIRLLLVVTKSQEVFVKALLTTLISISGSSPSFIYMNMQKSSEGEKVFGIDTRYNEQSSNEDLCEEDIMEGTTRRYKHSMETTTTKTHSCCTYVWPGRGWSTLPRDNDD